MKRYEQLLRLIDIHKPKSIFEFGTWNGERAIQMIDVAQRHNKDVQYFGLDLFEDATPENDIAESNVKQHFSAAAVLERIKDATGIEPTLFKTNSRTLDRDTRISCDFVFIDGGHSLETIQNDFDLSRSSKVIVLDDYYAPDEHGKMLDVSKFGCNKLVDSLQAAGISVAIMPSTDRTLVGGKPHGLVQMAVVPAAAVGSVTFKVKTKNIVSDEVIQGNIKSALARNVSRAQHMRAHNGLAVLCSGGPSLKDYFREIRAHIEKGDTVFTVKHAHDELIANGIIPFGCILLDPRGHVKDFIANPHPDVMYFVASMCADSTWETLVGKGAKICMYHAMVGAGEVDILKKTGQNELLVTGGCAAATRGLSLAHLLGFRNAILYGYDLCYEGPGTNRVEARVSGATMKMGGPIWTDYEKIAQANELSMLLKSDKVELEVIGGAVASLLREQVPRRQEFARVFAQPC